jgi:hypothetical protein
VRLLLAHDTADQPLLSRRALVVGLLGRHDREVAEVGPVVDEVSIREHGVRFAQVACDKVDHALEMPLPRVLHELYGLGVNDKLFG